MELCTLGATAGDTGSSLQEESEQLEPGCGWLQEQDSHVTVRTTRSGRVEGAAEVTQTCIAGPGRLPTLGC